MLTDRQKALMGPRGSKQRGSVEWIWQTLEMAKSRIEDKLMLERELDRTIEELVSVRAWTVVPHNPPYRSLDDLLKGEIGHTTDEARKRVQQHAAEAKELRGQGRPRGNKVGDTKFNNGTTADYLAARIKRDHPKIHRLMLDGKYASVRAAAIDAGIVSKTVQHAATVDGFARAIVKHLGADALAEIERMIRQIEKSKK